MATIVKNLFALPITLKVGVNYTVSMGQTKKRYTQKREAEQLPMEHYSNLVKTFIENELPEQFHKHTYSLIRTNDNTFIAVCIDQ